MPSKTSKKRPVAELPNIPKELIDRFVSGPMSAEAVNAASMAFKKALIERALGAEGVSEFLCVRRRETFPRCCRRPLSGRGREARWESR